MARTGDAPAADAPCPRLRARLGEGACLLGQAAEALGGCVPGAWMIVVISAFTDGCSISSGGWPFGEEECAAGPVRASVLLPGPGGIEVQARVALGGRQWR